ncbi:DUF3887 domain-containing protein [Thermococcus sp. M39]|uniref:DUF3887 domain-containing protein n=1 Tax=unclassified Thermococcus TaxID=2627626 RepID=UPI00143A27FD|nr:MULTISPECIES: DUF3887 domain-containing protein [unclassified Thermococcus]NJE08268.1 DUF3887 domain-containing protein [Thermococcus sp. M39]NJE11761.1 DUF3887 domain-containing protein [Thermococcus sp. LS2]
MKKIILSLFLLVMVSTSLIHAAQPYDEVAKAVFESLKTGNYSILEPYLDEKMKEAFNEKSFNALREQMISKYGNLESFEFAEEGKAGEFILGYYHFEFEKANVTIKLVFSQVDSEYKLSGLWIKKVIWKEKGIPLPLAVSLPILGGILALLTVYTIGFKKIKGAELILGFFLVAVTLFIQPIIQQAPFLALGIKSNADIIAKGFSFTVITAIWLGFVAGFFQESLKYAFVRNKTLKEALFIGIGFGLGEAVLVPLLQVVQSFALGGLPPVQLTQALLSSFERYIATLFHGGTTLILAYAYKNGFGRKALVVLSIAHSVIDTFAAYYQLTNSQTSLIMTYGIIIVITLILLQYAIPKAKVEKEEEKVVW